MSTKKALLLSMLVPVTLAAALPAAAIGRGGPEREMPSFSELDANGDGLLTLEEMQEHRAARFAETDTDGDGQLSLEEAIAAAEARAAERVNQMFERYDDDENGVLSENERDDMRPRGFNPDRMFSRLDTDGDGALSAEEFAEAAERREGRRGGWFNRHN